MKMFGTNGIRGVANEYMCPELAVQVGKSIGFTLKVKKIAIACDPRTSSQMIVSAVCSGLTSAGIDVLDLGIVPTPALQYYVKTHDDIGGGVMITASHNPPQYNGIKCIAGDGTEFTKAQESAVEDAYETEIECVSWDKIGHISKVEGAGEGYIDAVISKIDADAVRKAKIKIVLDCSNGAACETTPMMMKKLGVEIIPLNCVMDGTFPGHESEPTEENLQTLIKTVGETDTVAGMAHDGDADRCVFVTGSGKYVPGDLSLALIAGYKVAANKGGIVCAPVSTSSAVKDTVESSGGEFRYTAVGSPIVARTMMETGGIFGGEDNGGLIFPEHQYCRDGAMGMAAILEIIAKKGSLDDLISKLPKYHSIKITVKCPEDRKKYVSEKVTEKMGSQADTTDGVRLNYDDGWVLIRASGTEPKFRVYSESSDEKKAKERSDCYRRMIEDLIAEKE